MLKVIRLAKKVRLVSVFSHGEGVVHSSIHLSWLVFQLTLALRKESRKKEDNQRVLRFASAFVPLFDLY